jgi:replicative DNA helicase
MTKIPIPNKLAMKISNDAVTNARNQMQGYGWSSKSLQSLQPLAEDGKVGIRTSQKYLMHQERGIKPFLMTWVNNRTLPMGCKAQPLDAKVLTPTGWKLMGDLCVGDELIDPMGEESHVEAIFPQGEREIFTVTLADGSQTQATADHLWALDNGTISTTLELKKRVDELLSKNAQFRKVSGPHKNRWFPRLPQVHPVRYQDSEPLPIPPYTMGALLGDGDVSDRKILFHSADKEIVYRVENELPEQLEINHINEYRYHIRLAPTHQHKTGRTSSHPYLIALKQMGVHGHTCYTKFIPDIYKRSTVSDRVDLLRGLFDTDGTCTTTGAALFYTTSPQLARDVKEVVSSAGGKCGISERLGTNYSTRQADLGKYTGRTIYVLAVNSPVNIFHVSRKSERFRVRNDSRMRRVVSIVPTSTAQARCIKVTANSKLYVTDDFIPTHNSGDGPHFRRGGHVGEPGYVNIPHVGQVWRNERWKHPGLQSKNFMKDGLEQAIRDNQPVIKQWLKGLLGQR